jgi:hypothetical protein
VIGQQEAIGIFGKLTFNNSNCFSFKPIKMNAINLEWHKIVNLNELISIEEELKGKSAIYVWGWFDEENNFVPMFAMPLPHDPGSWHTKQFF